MVLALVTIQVVQRIADVVALITLIGIPTVSTSFMTKKFTLLLIFLVAHVAGIGEFITVLTGMLREFAGTEKPLVTLATVVLQVGRVML